MRAGRAEDRELHAAEATATSSRSATASTSVDALGDVERHLLADLLGHVVEVAFVPLRQDDLREPGAVRGQHLLLHAADRQHPALQRDLAGHADLGAHRRVGQQRHERGRHRDAGARAVLRHGAGGHVHVEPPAQPIRLDAELRRRATARS